MGKKETSISMPHHVSTRKALLRSSKKKREINPPPKKRKEEKNYGSWKGGEGSHSLAGALAPSRDDYVSPSIKKRRRFRKKKGLHPDLRGGELEGRRPLPLTGTTVVV